MVILIEVYAEGTELETLIRAWPPERPWGTFPTQYPSEHWNLLAMKAAQCLCLANQFRDRLSGLPGELLEVASPRVSCVVQNVIP